MQATKEMRRLVKKCMTNMPKLPRKIKKRHKNSTLNFLLNLESFNKLVNLHFPYFHGQESYIVSKDEWSHFTNNYSDITNTPPIKH